MSYCSGCKQVLPIPPGLPADSWVVTAHVVVVPGGRGIVCRPQRTYSVDERIRNWEDDSMWDMDA